MSGSELEGRIQMAVNQYMASDESHLEAAALHLSEIVGQNEILFLVKALGLFLTQSNDEVRAKATICLANYYKTVKSLRTDQVTLLLSFFAARLSERQSFEPVLAAITQISDHYTLERPFKELILSSISACTDLAVGKNERSMILSILNILKSDQLPGFVDTFVKAISGEKNPENLIKALNLELYILEHYKTNSTQREELFDCVFCYFPVTFSAQESSQSDYRKVLHDLLEVLLVRPEFVHFTIQGALKKLNALSLTTKSEALLLIEASLVNLAAAAAAGNDDDHLTKVWNAIFDLYINGPNDDDLKTKSENILTKLVECNSEFNELALQAFKDTLSPITPKTIRCCKAIAAIDSRTGSKISNGAISPVILELQKAIGGEEQAEQSVLAAELILTLLQPHTLDRPFDAIYDILDHWETSGSVPLQLLASIWTELALTPGCDLFNCVSKILALLSYAPEVLNTAVDGLGEIALKHTSIYDIVISDFVRRASETEAPSSYGLLEKLLSRMATSPYLTSAALKIIRQRLEYREVDPIVYALLDHTKTALKLDYCGLVDHQIYSVVAFILERNGETVPDYELIERLCIILGAHPWLLKGDKVVEDYRRLVEKFEPRILESPWNLTSLCLPLLEPDHLIMVSSNLERLYQLIKSSPDFYTRLSYLRLAAMIANATCGMKEATKINTEENPILGEELSHDYNAWQAKGMMERGDEQGFHHLEYVLSQFEHFNSWASRCLTILIKPDQVLSGSKAMTTRRLSSQRILATSTKYILNGLKRGVNASNYASAFSVLISSVPVKQLSPIMIEIAPLAAKILPVLQVSSQLELCRCLHLTMEKEPAAFDDQGFELFRALRESSLSKASPEELITLELGIMAQLWRRNHQGQFSQKQLHQREINELQPLLSANSRSVRKAAAACLQTLYS